MQTMLFVVRNNYALYIAESMGFEPTLRLFGANRISSAAPSTSRTTLHVYFNLLFFFAQISVKKFLERKAGENTEKYSIFNFENPLKSRISGGRNNQAAVKFRVKLVMTTSIHLRVTTIQFSRSMTTVSRIISSQPRYDHFDTAAYHGMIP